MCGAESEYQNKDVEIRIATLQDAPCTSLLQASILREDSVNSNL
jgi:hypothetical protein